MRLRTSVLTGALCAACLGFAGLTAAQISIGISVRIAPPALPVYEQPAIPATGYLWTPGYWAWSAADADYYWVPGTWVLPPRPGLLWTPGYWGWSDGAYLWHEGYWAPHVGFYGGVDYGFGYGPRGYEGGYWDHGRFFYNTAVTRVRPGVRLTHSYTHPVPHGGAGHVSFNGGRDGVQQRPTAAQLGAEREHHVMPVSAQRQLVDAASHDQQLHDRYNHGHPGVGATSRPEALSPRGGEAAHAPQPRPGRGVHAPSGAAASIERRGPLQSPRGQRPAARSVAPGNAPAHPRVNIPRDAPRGADQAHPAPGYARPGHSTPNFAPREHVPTTPPRGAAHGPAQPGPHAGARGQAPGHGGEAGAGRDEQHPPRR